MNFHLQNKKKTKSLGKKFFLGFTVLIVLLLLINILTNGFIANSMRGATLALWKVNGNIQDSLDSVHNSAISREALLKERDLLKERVRDLELYALNNLVLVSENIELQNLLGNENVHLRNGVLARVISRGGEVPYGTITIASASGVPFISGSLVFGAQNVLIGSLTGGEASSSLVTLVSASDLETLVLIGTDERITQVTLVGTGNGNMTAKIPRDADIRVNDPVVLFAEETALVGLVGDIEMKPTDAFQLVRVRTPLNLSTIRFVRVR
ncbi:MAG: hypothetical protein JKX80_01535 [Candidatus Pacebacteria bacterium]|nr:hypothetical protein [Candidatus Paceibacterota bacterium]